MKTVDCLKCKQKKSCCDFGVWVDLEEAKKIISLGLKGDFYHLEEEKRRKAHNAATGEKITKLKMKKENLRLEMYAKSRALSDPRIYRRRDEETAKEYGRRIKEIGKLMAQIDEEIKTLKTSMIFINENP